MQWDNRELEAIKGFMDPEEGNKLYELAILAGKTGPCLEIGSYCGKSTVYLGTGCKQSNGILFTIDHHRGSEEQQPGEGYFDPELFDIRSGLMDTFPLLRKTLRDFDLENNVIPIVSQSEVVAKTWTTPLSLLFIDGGHAYETVFKDYSSWAGHVMPGGYLLIHDIFEDPKEGGQAPFHVYSLAVRSGLFHVYPRVKTLGVLRRRLTHEVFYENP